MYTVDGKSFATYGEASLYAWNEYKLDETDNEPQTEMEIRNSLKELESMICDINVLSDYLNEE